MSASNSDEGEIIEENEENSRVVVVTESNKSRSKIELELRSRLLGRISIPGSSASKPDSSGSTTSKERPKHSHEHEDDEEMFSLQPGEKHRLALEATSSSGSGKKEESVRERRPISPPRFSSERERDRERGDRRGASSRTHEREPPRRTPVGGEGRSGDKKHARSPRDRKRDEGRDRLKDHRGGSERERLKDKERAADKTEKKERPSHHKERERDRHERDKDRKRRRKEESSSSESSSSEEEVTPPERRRKHDKEKEMKEKDRKTKELFDEKRKRNPDSASSGGKGFRHSPHQPSAKPQEEKPMSPKSRSKETEEHESPMDTDEVQDSPVKNKPTKYSKFESSPEPEDEHLEDEGRQSTTPYGQDDAADIDSNPASGLDDEMEDESAPGAGDDAVEGEASFEHPMGYDFDPDNVKYEDLTDEQKAMLTPDTKKKLEDEWQQRLIDGLPVFYPGIMGCRSVIEFDCVNRVEEGTFGVVYRAKDKRTDEIVALKRLKMEKEKEGFPITALREINMLLKAGDHENIVNVREIVIGSNMDKIYMVMEFIEHDMKSLMDTMYKKNKKWTMGEQKTLMKQLLAGLNHMHNLWILHRDLKTSNLLLSHKGVLKIADFGLAREYGDPLKPYTPIVVTLWYRAPELLLGQKLYSTPIDLWSVGCIMAEFILLKPLLPGKGEVDQIEKIFHELGTPSETIWPGFSELPYIKKCSFPNYQYNQLRKKFPAANLNQGGWDLLNKLLTYNPDKRITATEALKHNWFTDDPQPTDRAMFPTFPAKSEQHKAPPPSQARQEKPAAVEIVNPETAKLMKELNVKPEQIKPGGFALKFDKSRF